MTTERDEDVTGWCTTQHHDGCDGVLRGGTGLHWFCADPCHPEPSPDGPGGALLQDAIDVWRAARARLASTEEQP